MSATNTTTNLGLSQFVNTDVPAWRQDYNGDMLKIDNAYTADISGATAETSADPSDYMKFYDVSATTNKKILISDLLKGAKVEDLTDTDITTPIEDDALVYDATAQKWKNVPIMTKEQWQKNGAYNLCPNEGSTVVTQGVTYTVNSSNKTVVATWSSAPTGTALYTCSSTIKLDDGTYKLVGCPTGGNWGAGGDKYKMFIRNITDNVEVGNDYGNGVIFTAYAGKTYGVYIVVGTAATDSGLTFKPMITTDLNATYADYVPYAKTNRQLTELAKSVSYNALNVADKTGDFSDSITNVPNGEYIAILRIRSKSASGNISTEINLQECTVITNAAQFNHYVSMTKVTVTNNTVTFHSKTYTTATLQDAYIALIPLS